MTAAARHCLIVVLALGAPAAAAGCSGGCGDEAGADLVQVQLDQTTVGDDRQVRVTLCQDGQCDSVAAPATQFVVDVSVSELAIDLDLDEPGEVTVEVVDASGRELATSVATFDFDASSDGLGCASVREQEIAVTRT